MTALVSGMSLARWQWRVEEHSDGVLVLRLSGRWLMHDHLPPRAVIARSARSVTTSPAT